MADDVQVKFGGDASGIKSAADQAKAASQSFATASRTASLTAADAFRTLSAEIRANTEVQRASLATMEDAAAAARDTASAVGTLRTGVVAATAGWVAYEVAATAASVSLWKYKQIWADAIALPSRIGETYQDLQQIAVQAERAATAVRDYAASYAYIGRYAQIADVDARNFFGGISRYAVELQRSAQASAVAASGVSDFAGRVIAAQSNMESFALAAGQAGFGTITEYLNALITEIARVPGMTNEAAAGIVALFGSIPGLSDAAISGMVSTVRMLNSTTDEAKKDAEALANAMRDPAASGEAYLKNILNATSARKEDFTAAKATLDINQMDSVILSARADKLRAVGNEMTRRAAEQIAALNQMNFVQRANSVYIEKEIKDAQRFVVELEKQSQLLERQAATLQTMAMTQGQIRDAANAITAGGPEGRLSQLAGQASILRQDIQGATGDAAVLLRKLEDFRDTPYWDVNHLRTGYGSSTKTDSAGNITEVTAETTVTREDAERDLQRRIKDEFAPRAATQIGAAWEQLSAAAQASLTSVAYNRGSLTPQLAAAARRAAGTGSEAGIAEEIRRTPGVASRRAQEADNITAGGAGPNSTALRTNLDTAQQLRNTLAGGNAEQLAAAENARVAAAGMRDEVSAAERLLAAAKEDAANAHSAVAMREAAQRVAQAEATLSDRRIALIRSEASLQTATMEAGSAERARILNEAVTQDQARYAKESAEWKRLEQEKIANSRQVEQAIAADKAAAEESSYRNESARLNDRMREIRQEASERGLSFEERRTLTQQVNGQIEALELRHQARLQEIWGEGTTQFRQAQTQIDQIAAQSASRRAKSEAEVQKAVYLDTKRSYEQIGSTITGNVFSVIQGQASIKQAAANTAMSLIQSYAQAKVRNIADWLASVTTHTTGEATKTATTVTAVAARSTAEAGGAAASESLQAADALTSIGTSAAKTFAGIFGWLAPFLGPAAAGPAAAGEATVLAAGAGIAGVASHAIGSWSLPNDMLSMVHQGEMIVPKSQTPWVQDMIRNRGDGEGGGGAPNINLTFHANGRMTQADIREHADTIARTVAQVFNSNPSKRPTF